MLVSVLDARYYDDIIRERYNFHLQKFYTDIMQFIVAHYCFTSRDDTPFWRAVKNTAHTPEHLEARLETFRRHLPTNATKGTSEVWMFRDISWFAVLLGMNFSFDTPELDPKLLSRALQIRERNRRIIEQMGERLPNHFKYLRKEVYPAEQL